MKVAILVYPHCSMWSVTGAMELLLRANKAHQYFLKNEEKQFSVVLVSSNNNNAETIRGISFSADSNIEQPDIYDLILIPGFDYDPIEVLKQTNGAEKWICKQYENGAKVASLCTGSFLVAQSGILNGKSAVSHWLTADIFRQLYPEVKYCSDKTFVDNGNIIISGGATTFQNLILYLIGQYMGRQVALGVSKLYLIDPNKDDQRSYAPLDLLQSHKDEDIHKVQKYIEDHVGNKFSLDQLANRFAISKRSLIRRFKKATDNTPLQFIQKVKVEAAKNMLETEGKTFEQIACELGYDDVNAFRKLFVKLTGVTPINYRRRYSITYC